MRKRFSDKHQLSTLSELNVTPLLDLAFVLLIIFMITTPLMENSTDLVVPTSKGVPGAATPENTLFLHIDKNYLMKLDDRGIALPEIEPTFKALRQERPEVAVVVRAHKELSVQQLVDVTNALKRAGITRVGIQSASPQ